MPSPCISDETLEKKPTRPGTWVLLALIGLAGMTVGATWLFLPTLYWSESWVECISNKPPVARTLIQPGLNRQEHARFVNSQAAMIESPDVLSTALKTLEVRSTAWFKNVQKDRIVKELEQAIRSQPIKDTNFVRVSMGCRAPTDSATVVAQVVSQYCSMIQTRAKDEFLDLLADYRDEGERLDALVGGKLMQIREFAGHLPPGTLSGAGNSTHQSLMTLTEHVADLELQTRALEGLRQIYNDPGISSEDAESVERDEGISTLKQEQNVLAIDLASMTDLQENNEVREALGRRLAAIDVRLDELRTEKLLQVRNTRHEQIRAAFLNSQHLLMLTREAKMEAEEQQADLDRKRTELWTLNDELAKLRQARDENSAFVRDLTRVVRSKRITQVSIARRADLPEEPDYDVHVWLTLGSFAVPVVFGLGLVSWRIMRGRERQLA